VTTVACIVITHGARPMELRERCVESAVQQGFDECVVVGDFREGDGFRYLPVPDITRTTLDALVKRDCGTVATTADVLVYLSDDHALGAGFVSGLRAIVNDQWDVVVPMRWVEHPTRGPIHIPNGAEDCYCAGHAGVFRRSVVQHTPWTAQPHHPNWDVLASQNQMAAGFTFALAPGLAIQDLTPETSPWQ
jgi:hypothetical protein